MIGKRIKRYRINNNYSQKDLANILGVSTRSIVRWEQGKNKPNADELKKLSTLLCVDEDELINDSDNDDEDILDDEPSVLDRISEGVDNLVTGQESITDSLLSSKELYLAKQEALIQELKSQNNQLLVKLDEQSSIIESYKNKIDISKVTLRYKRIQLVVILVTCLLILVLVIGTWLYWRNHGLKDEEVTVVSTEFSPSYFEYDD